MFGKRKDGKELKKVDALFKVIPNIMMERDDSQVFFNQDVPIATIDAYIDKKAEEGIKVTVEEGKEETKYEFPIMGYSNKKNSGIVWTNN